MADVEGSLYHTYVQNHNGLMGTSYVEGNEALELGVSSSLVNAPGTNPEQFIGFALSTCFNATIRIVQNRMKLPEDSKMRTRVDIVKDFKGYKFIVDGQVMIPSQDKETAEKIINEALMECPVAKLLKDNSEVTIRLVDNFKEEPQYGE